jgi:hypothetical protein
MVKKFTQLKLQHFFERRGKFVVLPVMALISIVVIVLAVLAVVFMPTNRDSQYGVGADGFSAFVEKNASLGVDQLVSQDEVVGALGDKAKSVKNAVAAPVLNYGGSRAQTVTYDFVRSDGKDSSVYIDMFVFKDSSTLERQDLLGNAGNAGKVGEHKAYFLHALTFGKDREYRLLVIDGLNVYKFVMVQPFRNITISEVSAMAVLKTIASKAQFK